MSRLKDGQFRRYIREMPTDWFRSRSKMDFTQEQRRQLGKYYQMVRIIQPRECLPLLNMWIAAQHLFKHVDNAFSWKQIQSLRLAQPFFSNYVDLAGELRSDMARDQYPLRTFLKRYEEGDKLTAGMHDQRRPANAVIYWILFLNRSSRGGNWILPDHRLFGGPRAGHALQIPAQARFMITPLKFKSDSLFTLEGWVTDNPNIAEP